VVASLTVDRQRVVLGKDVLRFQWEEQAYEQEPGCFCMKNRGDCSFSDLFRVSSSGGEGEAAGLNHLCAPAKKLK
jgi:hypothetical protein